MGIDIPFTICSGLVMLIIGGILFFYYKKRKAGYLYQEEKRLKNIYSNLKTPEIKKANILGAVAVLMLFLGAIYFVYPIFVVWSSGDYFFQWSSIICLYLLCVGIFHFIEGYFKHKSKNKLQTFVVHCTELYTLSDFISKYGKINGLQNDNSSNERSICFTNNNNENTYVSISYFENKLSAPYKDNIYLAFKELKEVLYVGKSNGAYVLFESPNPINTKTKKFINK